MFKKNKNGSKGTKSIGAIEKESRKVQKNIQSVLEVLKRQSNNIVEINIGLGRKRKINWIVT